MVSELAPEPIDNVSDGRLRGAEVEPGGFVKRGAPRRCNEHDDACVGRDRTIPEKSLIVSLLQLDLAVEVRSVAVAQLIHLRIKLKRDSLRIRNVPENPIQRVA